MSSTNLRSLYLVASPLQVPQNQSNQETLFTSSSCRMAFRQLLLF